MFLQNGACVLNLDMQPQMQFAKVVGRRALHGCLCRLHVTFCPPSCFPFTPTAQNHLEQDTIRAGRPGNRQTCVAAARQALQLGTSVLLDR
jgi:hypothetical protein